MKRQPTPATRARHRLREVRAMLQRCDQRLLDFQRQRDEHNAAHYRKLREQYEIEARALEQQVAA